MNLNELTNEQREEYYQQVCKTVGLDPNLRLLDYIWIEQENGLKNLVLYCRRGGAEILRARQGIEVVDLIQHDGPGYVSFKAIGKNKEGRQEIANGTHSIEGLKGERLASAIMTASTRSLRRMTMQFTGCGILDESEVGSPEARVMAASQATLAGSPAVIPPLPPPQAPISQAPGKDVTATVDEKAKTITAVAQPSIQILVPEGYQLVNQSENLKQVYAEGAAALAATPTPVSVVAPISTPVENTPASETPAPRAKRPYRRRNQVDIASPGQQPQQTEMPAGHIDASGNIRPANEFPTGFPLHEVPSVPPATANEPERGVNGNGIQVAPVLADPAFTSQQAVLAVIDPLVHQAAKELMPPVLAPVVSVLPKEKQDEYRTRLSKYYNDILPRGGMQSSEGVGGPTMKVRKFAAIHTGVADTKQMTEQHWEDLFSFLDANAANPKFLVEYINKTLGVA